MPKTNQMNEENFMDLVERHNLARYIQTLQNRVNRWRSKLIGASLLESSFYESLIDQTLKTIEANKKILNNS